MTDAVKLPKPKAKVNKEDGITVRLTRREARLIIAFLHGTGGGYGAELYSALHEADGKENAGIRAQGGVWSDSVFPSKQRTINLDTFPG